MEAPIQLSKKVLIVSSWAPPQVSGSAHLLYNLFSHFDSSTYCIYTSRRNFSSDEKANRRILSGKYFFFEDGPIFKTPLFPFTYSASTIIFTKIYQKIRRGTIKTQRAYTMIKSGLDIIKKERIELLIGTSDMGPSLILTFLLSKLSGKPYIFTLFDLYRENNLSSIWKTVAVITEKMLFREARAITTITEEIRNLYVCRYGNAAKYNVIQQCVIESAYQNICTHTEHGKDKIIVFTGSIYWAQQKSLLNMVKTINSILEIPVKFMIYTPKITDDFQKLVAENNGRGKTEILTASPDEIPAIQCGADILFLPLSWNTPGAEVVRMAVPFKLVEYMATNKPIIILAPSESAVSQYAKKYGFAHTICSEETALLKEGVLKILSDDQYAGDLVSAGKRTFNFNHNSYKSALKLKKIIEYSD